MAHIHEGGSAMFDALVYARPHENTLQFLQHHNQQFFSNLNDAGRQFVDAARAFYDQMGLAYGADQLRALGRTVAGMWQTDEIRVLRTLEEFQNAPPVMRRWIMAEPTVRALYHQQRVDGYTNHYVDYFTQDVGEDHYDYRMAMNGVVVEDEEGNGWKVRTYYEDLIQGDQKLSMIERSDIQTTWEHLRDFIAMTKDDPTSPEGNERG